MRPFTVDEASLLLLLNVDMSSLVYFRNEV